MQHSKEGVAQLETYYRHIYVSTDYAYRHRLEEIEENNL